MRYHHLLPVLALSSLMLVALPALAADPAPQKTSPIPAAAPSQLYVCTCGRSKFPENNAFQDGRKDASVDLAWSFYAARSGSEATLIAAILKAPARTHVTAPHCPHLR